MVEGIQFKKISIKRQADSIFGDGDLLRLGTDELEGMVREYFGSDYKKAMDHLLKRRSKLLTGEDARKYQREYQKVRKEREYRIPVRFNRDRDKDIIDWLDTFSNKNDVIKEAIRGIMKKGANQ